MAQWPTSGGGVRDGPMGRLPADQAFSIAMMHTLACRRGQDALRRGVGELVDERTSTERGRPVITLSGVPEPGSSSKAGHP